MDVDGSISMHCTSTRYSSCSQIRTEAEHFSCDRSARSDLFLSVASEVAICTTYTAAANSRSTHPHTCPHATAAAATHGRAHTDRIATHVLIPGIDLCIAFKLKTSGTDPCLASRTDRVLTSRTRLCPDAQSAPGPASLYVPRSSRLASVAYGVYCNQRQMLGARHSAGDAPRTQAK